MQAALYGRRCRRRIKRLQCLSYFDLELSFQELRSGLGVPGATMKQILSVDDSASVRQMVDVAEVGLRSYRSG